MKTLLLVAGSRAGSDFFQSLLDGHPQVLQFPGLIRTNKKITQISIKRKINSPNPISRCKSKKNNAKLIKGNIK